MTAREKPALAVSRRRFVGGVSALASLTALAPFTRWAPRASAQGRVDNPFALGVASGDPDDKGVTLWTRLTRDPFDAESLPKLPIPVRFEVAEDESMRRVVRVGATVALARDAHSVHVRLEGLRPDRWYYYRFYALGAASRVGRTRTFPRERAAVDKMRFALASCQDYQNGFFSSYRNMASEDLDFVVHVGDYIYEDGAREGAPRQVLGGETMTLADYRNRHAIYHLDPALQDVHALFPFIATWDDHEVENNYAGAISEDDAPTAEFLARRAAAYQAYFEHMPVDVPPPTGPDMRLYRQLRYGSLAGLNLLDTRQFRTDQPCGDGLTYCPEVFDANATLLGKEQMSWLERNLERSNARWNVLAQQIMMTKWDGGVLTGFQNPLFNVDAWDGYQVARQRLLGFVAERGVENLVVLSGDIHSSWAADLKVDYADTAALPIGTEFVGTSISSDFPVSLIPLAEATLPSNPHIRFFDALHRGYVVCEVTPELWTTHYRGVSSIATPESPISTLATFVAESGRPGAQMG